MLLCGLPMPQNPTEAAGCLLDNDNNNDNYHNSSARTFDPADPLSCNFFMENWNMALCAAEWDMHLLVQQLVSPSSTVLELGGRYATTSCAIAARLANSGRLLVVEPDPSVWAVHEFNKLSHNCKSFSVFGVLGDEDAVVQGLAYNTRTRPVGEGGMLVKHFTWSQLEATTGLRVEQFLK